MKFSKGFTMIELLIVIAVMGILAVAVLAAINPIEQIDRSRDTGTRSDAEQLLSAIDRYYASKGYYPWQGSADDSANETALGGAFVNTKTLTDNVLNNLGSGATSELKQSFINKISAPGYNTLWLYNRGQGGDSTYACFVPQSGSFTDEAWKRCVDDTGSGLPVDVRALSADICEDALNTYSCLP